MSLNANSTSRFAEHEDPQLDLFPQTVEPRVVEPQFNLFVDLDPEKELARWRRRALFLTSVFLHIFLIMFIIFAPDLLRRGKLMMGIPVARSRTANHHPISSPGSAEVAASAASGSAPFRQESPGAGPLTDHRSQGSEDALFARQHA